MDQSVTFMTVATENLDAARTFYVEGLGWTPTLDVPGEILFFQVGPGVMLGLFEATHFAADLCSPEQPAIPVRGVTLSHNVPSPAEVDSLLAEAIRAGASVIKPAQYASFGGYHGHFADPNGIIWEIAHNPCWRVDEAGRVRLDAPPE